MRTTEISGAGFSDIGRVREENQDRFFIDREAGLFVVSDGMGGEPAGARAAEMVVGLLPPLLETRTKGIEDLTDPRATEETLAAISELSAKVREEGAGKPGLHGMGATVVVAMIRHAQVLVAHLGDSRAYLMRRGALKQLTTDHSLAQLLVESGGIRPEEAITHPARHQLTRSMGMGGEALPEACSLALSPGDRLLLCTDGLSGMVDKEGLVAILQQKQPPDIACKRLIDAANAAGARDNVSAIVVDVV